MIREIYISDKKALDLDLEYLRVVERFEAFQGELPRVRYVSQLSL